MSFLFISFSFSEPIQNCSAYLNSFYEVVPKDFDYETSSCVYYPNTQEFLDDPCCNPYFYRDSTKCCLAKNTTKKILVLSKTTFNTKNVCNNPSKISILLNYFLSIDNYGKDPSKGISIFIDKLILFFLFFLFCKKDAILTVKILKIGSFSKNKMQVFSIASLK